MLFQPLAFWGQAIPATLPRFRNCCCFTIASASKLLSGLHGVQPMGNTPARDLPLGDFAATPTAANAPWPATARIASDAPVPCRNFRRLAVMQHPFDMARSGTCVLYNVSAL